jgi:hypothetical protein
MATEKTWGGVVYRSKQPEPQQTSATVHIPEHLLPVLCKIAQRQRTTLAAVVAQALSDYCAGGL